MDGYTDEQTGKCVQYIGLFKTTMLGKCAKNNVALTPENEVKNMNN